MKSSTRATLILLGLILLLAAASLACSETGGTAGCQDACRAVDLPFDHYRPASEGNPPSCWCAGPKGAAKLW